MPSPSLFLGSSTTLVSALLLLSSSASATSQTYYALDTDYSGKDFFDGFNFFADADPTHGFVTYVDEDTAKADGLINTYTGSAQIKVDSTNKYDGTAAYSGINGVGRPSVRIESVDSWTHGLFIADIKHMPTTTDTSGCGVWPAFWTLGSGTWPYNGEIDIIEGANNQANDLTSAHVAGTCVISQSSSAMSGTSNGNNCQYDVSTGANAQGCGAFSKSSVSYGAGFNANKGGVYAMEWKSDAIKIWFFPRGSIPSDIGSGNPDPSGWGNPDSLFNGPGCDIDANFADNRIIFDTTFCGDFGDATWTGGGCAAVESQPKCSVFVGSSPEQFTEAYWDVNYVRVYQPKEYTSPTTTSTSTTTTTTWSSSSTTTTTTATTTTTTTSETTTTTTTYSHPFGDRTTTTSETTTTTPYVAPTSSSPTPSPVTTSTSSWSFPVTTSTPESPASTTTSPGSWDGTSSSSDWSDWVSSTTKPVDPATTSSTTTSSYDWADWESSTTKPVDPATTSSSTTSSFDWADWESSKTSSSKPVDPATTSSSSFDWADWEASKTSSTTKPVDPASTSSVDWADWEASKSSTTKPVDPATATSSVDWADWEASHSSTTKPVDPATTGTYTWGDWESTNPGSKSSVAASSTWVSPSVTIATTVTVAPVASSAWVAASSVTPVAAASTGPHVATYTGAAGRTGMNTVALLGAAVVGLGAMAL